MDRRKLTDRQKRLVKWIPGRIVDFGIHERGIVVLTMMRPWCCAPPRETLWLFFDLSQNPSAEIVRDINPKEVQWGWA